MYSDGEDDGYYDSYDDGADDFYDSYDDQYDFEDGGSDFVGADLSYGCDDDDDDDDDDGSDEVAEQSSDDDGGNSEDGHEGQQNSYSHYGHSTQFPANAESTRQGQNSSFHQRTSKTEIRDKQSGDYMRKTVKESSSSGDVFKESRTGRAGIKDEYERTSTFRTGNKGGFQEYQLTERFRTVNYGLGINYVSISTGSSGQNLLPSNNK